jgi:hypothetical protein
MHNLIADKDYSFVDMNKDGNYYISDSPIKDFPYLEKPIEPDFRDTDGYENSKHRKEWDTAANELDNYKKGRYDYDSEKGWHLKESVEKTVNNVINELLNKKQ